MKKLILGLAMGLFVVSLPVGRLVAQQPAEETMEFTTTTVEEETGNNAQSKAEARKARIEANKQRNEERLSANQERRLASRCENAQISISRLSSNVETVVANRQAVYTGVAERLKRLAEKAEVAGADTTELSGAITELEVMNQAFGVLAEDYLQALADLSAMDNCTEDPAGFKSTLDEARKDRPELFQKSQEMRVYINDTIKPILQTIRASLLGDSQQVPDESTAESESSEEATENTEEPVETTEEQ